MRNARAIVPDSNRVKERDRRSGFASGMPGNLIKYGLAAILLAGTVAACVVLINNWEYVERFQNWGYFSAFIFGFIAGSSLPVPLPYLVVTFSLGGLLVPPLVGLASGLGAGIGGTLVYMVGHSGRQLFPGVFSYDANPEKPSRLHKIYQRMQDFSRTRGALAVFLMSAILNPVFIPMAITAGVLRFGIWRFLFWCTLGNIVKSTAIAYCGYFGLAIILQWTGG